MKRIIYVLAGFLMICSLNGCKKTSQGTSDQKDSATIEETIVDTTVYGVCGEGTSMHSLEVITDAGDTLNYLLLDDENGIISDVQGGLLCGDRLAVIATVQDSEMVARKVINLTTIIGKWTSIDKNFDIEEGGEVVSSMKAETNPWTSWKILNGHLLLNRDTFDIVSLGADSLCLENKSGIFVYKRAK